MYPQDIFKTKQTKTMSVKKAKFPMYLAIATAALFYTRVNVGMLVIGNTLLTAALNILTLIIYFFITLTLMRKYLVREKEKVRQYSMEYSRRELRRYSKVELRSDDASTYHYGNKEIYLPELNGYRTTFIKMTHLSYSNERVVKNMLEELHNFCMKRNLLLTKIDMPKGIESFNSIKYMSRVIDNADHLTPEQISRASLRYDYTRTLCETNTVVEDVYQITATDMNNNLAFPQHSRSVMSLVTSKHISMDVQLLGLEEVKEFYRNFFKLAIIDLNKLSENKISNVVKSSVLLHTVKTDTGETFEFTPIMLATPPNTTIYNGERAFHYLKEN